MADEQVITAPATDTTPTDTTVQPSVATQLASAIWGETPAPATQEPAPVAPAAVADTPPAATEPTNEIISPDEWVKKHYGWENADAGKKELEELRKLRETAQTPAEIKFANDEAKRYYEAITSGKTDDLYNILHQQRQLSRLENLTIANANEAADIIKANLQFKYKDLNQQQIDRLYTRQYALPEKPQQLVGQEDADYEIQLESWKQAVQEKEQDIMIDARIAKPELLKYKSELVLPDIPQVVQQPQPDQKALEAQQAFETNFKQKLSSDYQNFKGYNVTAKDGEVELPISYGISTEELAASKQMLENLNVNEYLDKRWFDEQGNPRINQMQKDLHLLENFDKIAQKLVNEASAQRFLHQQKIQNNIKLNGITTPPASTTAAPDTQAQQKQMAEFVWNL